MAELRQFGQGTPTEAPESRRKRSTLGKVGKFLAPTTAGILTGEKKVTGRTLLGAGLELGSFALPAGAVLRGFGAISRGARAVGVGKKVAAPVAKKAEGVTFESLRKSTGEFGRKLKSEAKTAAQIGGVVGAGFGAGRALGEEDLSLKEVAGEAAIGAGIGVVGGAVLAPAVSIVAKSARATSGFLSNQFQSANARLNPTARKAAVEDLTESLSQSFEGNASIFGKLSKSASQAQRIEGPAFNERSLFGEVVEAGYMPKVRGGIFAEQRADFRGAIQNAQKRRRSLSKGVTARAKGVRETVKLSDIEKEAKARLVGRTDIDPTKVSKQISAIIKNIKAEFKTNTISAEQVDIIRRRTTAGTKAFKKAARTGFVDDAQNSIRTISRAKLNTLDSEITRLNAESGKIARIIDTMETLSNQKIDVGFLSTAFGRYLGVIVGAGAIAGGPGALVLPLTLDFFDGTVLGMLDAFFLVVSVLAFVVVLGFFPRP